MNNNIILVSGYGWSGSGLMIDMLKSQKKYISYGSEFPLLSEPNGLLDLENSLINNWHFLKSSIAIKKYKEFALKLNKKKSFLNPYGLNISQKLKLDFEIEVNNFLNELISFEFDCRTRINNFHDPLIKRIYKRLIWKFFDLNKSKMFFSYLGKDEFYLIVKKFHDNLFKGILSENNLILDQAIPTTNAKYHKNYFNKSKFIIVDRDPRDIFADLLRSGGLIGQELAKLNSQSVNKFIKWHKVIRKQSALDNNVLSVFFEDLILETKKTQIKVSNYLQDEIDFSKYDLSNSKKNIGIWKNLPNEIITMLNNEFN